MSRIFEQPTQEEMLQREDEFFSRGFMMSYSGLNKLLFSPKVFYMHYLLGHKEDTTDKAMIEGKLIHCLFLKPENFDKEFVLMATDIPSDNPKEVLHRLYDYYVIVKKEGDPNETLAEFSNPLIDILYDMNLYQSYVDDKKLGITGKTGDQKRLDKIITPEHESYWEYLKNREGKINVDKEMHDYAVDIVEQLKANKYIMQLMGYETEDMLHKVDVMNEIELAAFPEGCEFGLRGFIDNLVIDHRHKVIRVNDLKKTSKDINNFEESIEYYNYWIQACIYYALVRNVYLTKPEYGDYTFEFRFIVVDKFMQIAPIKVSDKTLAKWITKTNQCLIEANYHFKNRNFDLPYKFLINKEFEI